MADQDFNLNIITKANTSGAKEGEKALKDVEKQVERTSADADNLGDALQDMLPPQTAANVDELTDEIDQLTQKLLDATPGSKDFTEAQAALAAALQKSGDATAKVMEPLGKVDLAAKEVAKSKRNGAVAVLEFSRAFEDAQYGIRGVLNNIPGLLSALGAGAGLAGVVSIAAVALNQFLGPAFEALDEKLDLSGKQSDKRKEKAEELNEALRQTTLAAEKTKFDNYIQQIEDAAEAQSIWNERMNAELKLQQQLREAREQTLQALLQTEEKMIRVQATTGLISPEEAAAKQAALRQQMNEASRAASEAAARVAENNAKLHRDQVELAIWDAKTRQVGYEREADAQAKRYEELTAKLRQKELELLQAQSAAQQRAQDQRAAARDEGSAAAGIFGKVAYGTAAEYVIKPQSTLAEEAAIKQVRTEMEAVADNIRRANEEAKRMSGVIGDTEKALTAAQENLKKTQQATSAKIESISQIAESTELVEKAEQAAKEITEFAEKGSDAIEEAIKDIEPQNRLQAESLEGLQKSIADGKLSAEEARKAVQQLANMGDNLNVELSKILGIVDNVQKNIDARDRFLGQLADQNKKLQDNVSQLFSR